MIYITFHVQKDRRITLGTCIHKYLECPSLKNKSSHIVQIDGEIVNRIPKCNWCYTKLIKQKAF